MNHTLKVLKGRVWGLTEEYLSNPACDLDGNLIDLHAIQNDVESNFVNAGGYGTCRLNPTFVERLNITNAFAQTRDRGVITPSDYHFVHRFLSKPTRQDTYRYNQVMHRACAAMVPIVFPKQYALAIGGEISRQPHPKLGAISRVAALVT